MNKYKIKYISIVSIFLITFITSFAYNNINLAVITNNIESSANTESVYDVILFWGQSNMVGKCKTREEKRYDTSNSNSLKEFSELSGIDEDILKNNGKNRNSISIDQEEGTIYEYMYTSNSLEEINSSRTKYGENLAVSENGSLVIASSTNNWANMALSESSGVNMIPEFCKTYYQNTGHKVVAVFAALGGRSICEFLPYDDADNTASELQKSRKLYQAIKEKYTKAIEFLNDNHYRIGSKLYVVFQGESDMNTTTTSYKNRFLKVHNNLKNDLGIQKGAIVETAREPNTYKMKEINWIHDAQEQLIMENDDIVFGSSFPYDRYIPEESDYSNCNTKVTLDSNGNKLSFNDAFIKASSIVDYMVDEKLNNGIHYTSAALSQIGRESAKNLANAVDHTAPTLSISYSTTLKTNQNVTATITSDEPIQELEGWILSNDKKTLTKIFKENATENLTIYDTAGNYSNIIINVSNIDNIPPKITINYDISELKPTNQNVIVTITSNEEIKEVEGWILSKDSKKLSKIFTQNMSEKLIIYDLAGNSSDIDINVTNIDLNEENENENKNENVNENVNENKNKNKNKNVNENVTINNIDQTNKPPFLPNTGTKSIILIIILILLIFSTILYIKNKNSSF